MTTHVESLKKAYSC